MRAAFDPDSGLDQPGKGHYPQCLVCTVCDVFRRLPIARTVQPIAQANEREEVKALLAHIPSGGVLRFDRGYPSYELIDHLHRHYRGYWLNRCPASATFPAVEAFVQSAQTQATITLTPAQAEPISLRAIRMISPDGELSVLLTNLQDEIRFPAPRPPIFTFAAGQWKPSTVTRKPPSTSKASIAKPKTAFVRNYLPS